MLQTLVEVGELLRYLQRIELNAGVHRQHPQAVEFGGARLAPRLRPGFLVAFGEGSAGTAAAAPDLSSARKRRRSSYTSRCTSSISVRVGVSLHFAERLGDLAFSASGTRRRNGSGGVAPPGTPACDGSPPSVSLAMLTHASVNSRQLVIGVPCVSLISGGSALTASFHAPCIRTWYAARSLAHSRAQLLRLEDLAVERPQRRITGTLYQMLDGGIEAARAPPRPVAGVERRLQRFSGDARSGHRLWGEGDSTGPTGGLPQRLRLARRPSACVARFMAAIRPPASPMSPAASNMGPNIFSCWSGPQLEHVAGLLHPASQACRSWQRRSSF